jgi:CubicO group peptidase (beta-lactamase class C family)
VSGYVAPGWEPVRAAFVGNLEHHTEVGAAVSVFHRGVEVVCLHGGWADEARTQPYAPDHLQLVFSTTKGITAIAVAICAQRGLIDYGEKVSTYWPEFAQAGKADATVAQLLSHQVGLPTVDGPITLAEALDWDTITARLAATAPMWPIGEAHGYHAITFGWLAGELVRRVDGRNIGRFVREEIAEPLGAEFWIGLPAEHEPRVSPLLVEPSDGEMDPTVKALMDQVIGPHTLGGRALSLNGAFSEGQEQIGAHVFNSRAVRAAEIPAANGITTASSLARIYAATIGEVDGVRLVEPDQIELARTTVTPQNEPDRCLLMPTTFGMGFMTHGMFSMYAGAGSFGHPGAGGSVGFAQPERELAFGYVMNQMAANLVNDLRAQRLIDAATGVIDGGI